MEGPKIGHCKAETARPGRSAGDNLPALTMAGYERQVKEMAVTLSSQEVAALTGKTERTVRRWAESGKIPAERVLNKFNSPEYLFSLDALEPHLQQKYFDGLKLTPSPEVAQTLTKEAKPLDTYSIEEQEEIAFWLRLVKQWQGYRNKPGANKTEVDANFVQWCKLEYPERAISVDTLYRRWNAVRDNDLDGLIDKRGKWKKGKSSIPDPMWQAFLYFYLDERQHPLKKCYEYTKLEMQTSFPELVGDMPSYTTFYRRAQADIPEPLKVLGREGEKAFRDRCAPYIRRVYDDMRSNEWWIADNHTFDIITEGENGQRHRLYLTAFFDARSGIFTGCYVTNAPSSQSTLIALRRGILKYGIPENIYVDNGREFLTYDVGGLGHRKKKPKDGQERFEPPPVFERLGIHMTNAIVRNAKAKIIERRFRDVKDHLSRLFDTFTGGNVLEKPESLKFILKDGRIPLDSTLVETVEELLDWYFNQQPYGGAVAKDHGKPRQQVYNENLHTKRVASAEDLNLMLMRSSRAQKVTRRGVHLDIAGQRIDYWNDELVFNYLGQQVYYRYDPDDLSEVRVYDLQDRFVMSVPADNTAVLTYGASKEEVKEAMAKVRRMERITKEAKKVSTFPAFGRHTALELVMEAAHESKVARIVPAASPKVLELQRPDEEPLLKAVAGGPDLDTMNRNAMKRNGGAEYE